MTLEDNCTAKESDLVELFSFLSRYGVLAYLVKTFHQKTLLVTRDTALQMHKDGSLRNNLLTEIT